MVLYASAIVPLCVIPLLHWRRLISSWVLPFYFSMFLVCAFGWEIWFNYGLLLGDNIVVRRDPILTQFIPMHLNWVLNSLADAGAICCGGVFFIWAILGRDNSFFRKWNGLFFVILLAGFIGQNLVVELFLYHDQLASDKVISWAPLSPFGEWLNPVLFEFGDRTVMLQTQLPWLIMTPLVYLSLIRFFRSQDTDNQSS